MTLFKWLEEQGVRERKREIYYSWNRQDIVESHDHPKGARHIEEQKDDVYYDIIKVYITCIV